MRYEAWIDRGGTFTDCILFDRSTGARRATKVLSSDEAPLVGLRQLLGLSAGDSLPPCDVKMGTTVATNALLERRGRKTALVITRGFGDLLELGDQTRGDLFALKIPPRNTLDVTVVELEARLGAGGEVLSEPSDDQLDQAVARILEAGCQSVALVVLHATAHPNFEASVAGRLSSRLEERGRPLPLSRSADVCPETGLLARASTTVLDAYVRPLLTEYLAGLEKALVGSRLRIMQSAGGLAPKERLVGPQAILSGPAGGIVAAERLCSELALRPALTLDMGGTSTDVSLLQGRPTLSHETVVEGVFLRTPMIDLHTVAAGGGSVCTYDGYRLMVGPDSVGADPGPLCYGRSSNSSNSSAEAAETEEPSIARGLDNAQGQGAALQGGDVAVTDVNLMLGRVTEDYFPFPLDSRAARAGLARVARRMGAAEEEGSLIQLAADFSVLVSAQMAEALRSVCLKHGVDAADAALVVFGGAAGQHACAIARQLGIARIVAHRLGGVFSALGMGLAPVLWGGERDARRARLGSDAMLELEATLEQLIHEGRLALEAERAPGQRESVERQVHLRYVGTESALLVPWEPVASLAERFHLEHEARFGYCRPDAPVECTLMRVEIRLLPNEASPTPATEPSTSTKQHSRCRTWRSGASGDGTTSSSARGEVVRRQPVYVDQIGWCDTPVLRWSDLDCPCKVCGPALILDETSTYLVEPGFVATVSADRLSIEATAPTPATVQKRGETGAEVPLLSLRISALAKQMGEALRRSASSTNIRDRLDFSCAVFDPEGHLVANAPHIPVHLGAMSETVRAVLRAHPNLGPEDAVVSNDPALGGSHLPDITVVTPVVDATGRHLGFTASRGHHADVGGITPGSMPAFSKTLEEEGVVLSAVPLVRNGVFLEEEIRDRLLSARYPVRKLDENLADLKAQLAANRLGARLLRHLAEERGAERLLSGFSAIRELSARWTRETIAALPDAPSRFADELDDGTPLVVEVRKEGSGLVLDFTGTGQATGSNLNAPRAVTVACALYALRVLIARPLPLNDGCLEPVEIVLPPDSLLAPPRGAPVAGGNVETSSRVCDLLFAAMGLSAASQGTMNNLSFGDGTFGYYETIAGGTGAGRDFDGGHAVHSHMTNTRITDPEVLEGRFPVRLVEWSRRRESGGAGLHPGGDGVRRELEALAPLTYSIMSERRRRAPFGLAGGKPGACGINTVDGQAVGGRTHGELRPGQRLRIATPGGGGYGPPSKAP